MMRKQHSTTSGQALVIFAVTLLVLLFFIGLAVDAGSLYITYGSLKRATDAAALAAVNEFKRDPDLVSMEGAASEVFNLMGIDYSNLEVLLCDMDRDNVRDTGLPPMFELRCPITPAENARKLVWVEAEQEAKRAASRLKSNTSRYRPIKNDTSTKPSNINKSIGNIKANSTKD